MAPKTSTISYGGSDLKERRKIWFSLNPHDESDRRNKKDAQDMIQKEIERRNKMTVRSRTSDQISKIKRAEPHLLSERLDALHLEVCKVDKEKATRDDLIFKKKIVARLGAYAHDRVPVDMDKWKLYRGQNPVFTLVFDACTALRAWFRMNKETVFKDKPNELSIMHSRLTRILDTCTRLTDELLLKYGEPITLYHLQSWVTILRIHYMQLKESRMLQAKNIPVHNDLRFEIEMPFNLKEVLDSYETEMSPGTRPESDVSPTLAPTGSSPKPNVPAPDRTPGRAHRRSAESRSSDTGLNPNVRERSERVRFHQGMIRSVEEMLTPVPAPTPSPAPTTPVVDHRRQRGKIIENPRLYDSDSSIDHSIYIDSEDDEPENEDVSAELRRGFQAVAHEKKVLAELARRSEAETVAVNDVVEVDETDDGDDSEDSDFEDGDLKDGDDSEDSDYADQAPARGNKRSMPKEPNERKVPIKKSDLAALRKKMEKSMNTGGHYHRKTVSADNRRRFLIH